MTVLLTASRETKLGNGVTTAFPFAIVFLANSDIEVTHVSAAGAATSWTEGVQYTLTGAGAAGGGTLTTTSGNTVASGASLVIQRNVTATQLVDFVPNSALPANTLEASLDKLTMLAQESENTLERTVRLPASDLSTFNELPSKAAMANKILAFDSSGNPIPGDLLAGAPTGTFTAAGTGAVQRTYLEKARDFIDVRDYGAVGDGTTDDTAAINAAVTAALAAGGGEIWFPPQGTYLFTDLMSLSAPSNLHFRSCGATIKARLTATENVWTFLDANHITIEGLIFDGGYGVTGFGSQILSFRDPSYCTVRNCQFVDWNLTAVLMFTPDRGASGNAKENLIEGCFANGGGVANIAYGMESMLRSRIVNCVAIGIGGSSPGYAINLKNVCKDSHVIGCVAETSKNGIVFSDDGPNVVGNGCDGCTIRASSVRDIETAGVSLNKTINCSVEAHIDMQANAGNGDGLLIAGFNTKCSYNVSLKNIATTGRAINSRSDDQTVWIKEYDDTGNTLINLEAGTNRNWFFLQNITTSSTTTDPRAKITDSSGTTDNEFISIRDLFGGNLSGTSNSIYFSLNGLNRTTHSVRFDTAHQFTIRGNAVDMFNMLSLTALKIHSGTGTPEGALAANPGSLFLRTDGGAGATLYVKETGTGNTGWAAK